MYDQKSVCIASIDPSVDNMGFSIWYVDILTLHPTLMHAETFKGKQLAKGFKEVEDLHGERGAKLWGHYHNFLAQFGYWLPDIVAIEQPFSGRFPTAFGALMECVTTVRNSVIEYNSAISLYPVDPPTVKMSVGVSGRSKDKNEMIAAVKKIPNVSYNPSLDLTVLDEHSCDAIAVGYWVCKEIIGVK